MAVLSDTNSRRRIRILLHSLGKCIKSTDRHMLLIDFRLKTSGVTWQNGADVTVRAQFINNGKLPNTRDTNFRAISNAWPVFAISHDLGNVRAATTPVVTSVGHIRDPALRYIIAGGATQLRSLYFFTQFSTPAAVVSKILPICITTPYSLPGRFHRS